MSTQAIIAAAQTYAKDSILAPYVHLTCAILANPKDFRFPLESEKVLVREVEAGNSSNYVKGQGFNQNAGKKGSVTWTEFQAMYDRQFVVATDYIDEMNAITSGNMELGGVALQRAYWENFAAEADAVVYSKIFSAVPEVNKLSQDKFPVTEEEIFKTLNGLRAKLFSAGISRGGKNNGENKIALFARADVYANIQSAIVAKNGLANTSVLHVNPTNDGSLSMPLELIEFNDFLIVCVPEDRLVSSVVLFDGISAGQEDGGFAPDTTNPDFTEIQLLAVPLKASKVSIRHMLSNMTVPAAYAGGLPLDKLNSHIAKFGELFDGQVTVANIGIDQMGDQFKFMNRVIYDSITYRNWRKAIFAVV